MPPTKVEGIDYTPEGIEALRIDVIKMRDKSLSCEPVPDFHTSVILSHAIAMLAYLIELVKEQV
jgi:hypothetical protein